jgi:hypothetical protein
LIDSLADILNPIREALSNKDAQRRLNFNLLAVNSFRLDKASLGQILPLIG